MTQLTAEDKTFIQTGSTMAVAAYGDKPPAGNWSLLSINNKPAIADQPSGFMARVYVNAETKQLWVAVAGTNGSSDVLAYPNAYIGWSSNTAQFQDALKFASDLNKYVTSNADLAGYSIATSGHSWGELFAQMFTYTFGWKGVGFDGVGARSIVTSQGYRDELTKLNETAVGGTSFITCDTAGLSLGPIKFGGGGIGSLGLDNSGTRQCTVNVEWGLVSGVAGLTATVVAANPLVGYLLTKLISAAGLHSMEGKIDTAVQEGDFTVDPVAPAEPKPFSYNDGSGNSLQAKTDPSGKVLKDDSGNAIFTATVTSDSGNVSQVDFTADGRVLSMSDASTSTDGSATNLFTATTNTAPVTMQTTGGDPTQATSADNSTLITTGTATIKGLGNVNTASGNTAYANNLLADYLRPGAQDLATEILGSHLAENFRTNPELAQSLVWAPEVKAVAMNLLATGVATAIPTDPLVLDLNGDGVKLTSFADAPVLFDIDHDSTASKEITGWFSKEDGIVVMDLNGNGKIDGIHETMSEYFNGTAGSGGNPGEKKYANGFAALKSLDSNADNQFTSADAAWSNVKVWVDADHDGVTDSGELTSLTALGITSIDLAPTNQSGLVNGGNEVLATGTFIQNGVSKEAQAARFIANPTGNVATVTANGTTVSAEDGQSTYVSSLASGESIDVTAKGVKNAYGNQGDDALVGNAGANWLVGGQGSDTFNAGAGDDILIIDAADLQQNIHAGDGFDMLQVVGTEGVTLNLAQAEVEVAVGGSGNDVLIGGGRSSVFIRADDGDDIVIGGATNDALSGENGNDLIDACAGNDVIRGGRGQDQLLGGTGDDLVEGGQDDDRLVGGAGNDVLKGQQGDDTLDGGDGTDIAEFSGSFADYRITRLDDATWRVVDTQAGRDGADQISHIEKLNFADVSAVDITLDNPLPVKDVLTIDNRIGVKLIKVADLLANDRDWQGDALHLTTISDLKGGSIVGNYNAAAQEWTPTLTANGELQLTPDPTYTGVMSFKYKIADSDNTPGATAIQIGTTTAAEMRGQVFIKTPDMPTDSLFTDQWYLSDINVLPVWKDADGQGYTGKGVRIAQFEPGMPFSSGPEIFDYRHPDLQTNADTAWLADPNANVPQSFSQHATLVAGVMVGACNGEGAVGVAYDAKLSGHYIQGTGLEVAALTQEITQALAKFKNYDVVNNSWGSTANFDINVVPVGTIEQGILDAVTQGRNGLGTAIVMAGDNERQNGGNTNTNALTANRAVIITGAINAQGDISTLAIGEKPFSNPGATILIAAPGSNIASTSRILMNDDGTVFGPDTANTQGTSFATPIVSGVVALMLEANPNLGWRDIQQILAH